MYSLLQNEKPTVLAVDDIPDNLSIVLNILKEDFRVKAANNGEKALRIARSESPPDLILLDIMMPGMDGFEVCRLLKADSATQEIPVIFLTARTETEDEKFGLDLGAADFISKPINPAILLARIKTQIRLKAASEFLKDKNEFLEQEIRKRTKRIISTQDVVILALASLAETRDSDTGNHIRRTQWYVKYLASGLKKYSKYESFLTSSNIELLFKSAPLHDIGKAGIPDRILLKPGKFESEEFEIMKTHPVLGKNAIEKAEKTLGASLEFPQIAKDIVLYHHEKWDGTGYPEGLSGENIPVSARLMAVADVYDALICRRIYKEPLPHEKAMEIIISGRGKHFDPDIVEVFTEIHKDIYSISEDYSDENLNGLSS